MTVGRRQGCRRRLVAPQLPIRGEEGWRGMVSGGASSGRPRAPFIAPFGGGPVEVRGELSWGGGRARRLDDERRVDGVVAGRRGRRVLEPVDRLGWRGVCGRGGVRATVAGLAGGM